MLLPGLTTATAGAADRAADRPDVVTVAGRRLSDEALDGASAALAARIAGAGVVAVDATPTLETVVAVVAALRAGVPVVPVAPDAGVHERRHILTDSAASLLLAAPGPRRDELAAEVAIPCAPVDVAARGSARPAALPGTTPPSSPPSAPAMILYTSGTTGPPKGVMTSAAAVAFDLDALADAWAWTAGDTVVHGLPLYHVHGLVLGVLGPLRRGGRLVHTGRPTPEAYAEAAAGGGTLFFGVPTVWARIAGAGSPARAAAPAGAGAELRRARLLVSGSAPLPAPVFEAVEHRCGHRLVERYGMTETLITLSGRADGPRHPGTVGGPLAGIGARVVDDAGNPVRTGDDGIGALEVSGPTLMDGYLGRPEDTAATRTADGWFRTGDVATVGADGSYRIVGRASTDLIKTGGFRVGAGEVEAALLAHPAVREAAVVGEPDDDLGQVVVAYVVADGAAPDLLDWARQHLALHKAPRRLVRVTELPRNALGKVQKSQLGQGKASITPH